MPRKLLARFPCTQPSLWSLGTREPGRTDRLVEPQGGHEMNEIPANFTGNLTRDPELRFTQSGQAVASISVAVTPRRYDATTKSYVDGETSFIDASVWGS